MSLVQLHEVAHGRTGDKGNRLNISVIAYDEAVWPIILDSVTEEKVLGLFRHKGVSRVVRYVVPNLMAINFVIDDVLEGGVNSSLNLDVHGKMHSSHLLTMPVLVPDDVLEKVRTSRSS